MWTCPRCKHRFVSRNQSHSCGHYTVGHFLKGKSPGAVSLFRSFIAEYRKIGAFRLDPVKTRVALLSKIRFAAINRIGRDCIDVHLVLVEPHPGAACFHRIENISDRFFVHHMRIRQKSDITPDVRKYMKLAYRVGRREHLLKTLRPPLP